MPEQKLQNLAVWRGLGGLSLSHPMLQMAEPPPASLGTWTLRAFAAATPAPSGAGTVLRDLEAPPTQAGSAGAGVGSQIPVPLFISEEDTPEAVK